MSNPDSKDTKKIKEIIDEFEELVKPLLTYGIVNENDLTKNQIRADDRIEIIYDNTNTPLEVTPFDIQLTNQLSANGVIGREWKKFPKLAPISAVLSHWILFQAPTTLIYDSAKTLQERKQARMKVGEIYDTFQRVARFWLNRAS